MPYFQERIVATLAGCITSIQAIYVPADDLTDPAPVVIFVFGHLDGITVPNQDRVVVSRARKIERFLSQPFFVAQIFTGDLDIISEGRFYLKGTICDMTNN